MSDVFVGQKQGVNDILGLVGGGRTLPRWSPSLAVAYESEIRVTVT